jgi:tetratricopeptide (TPR) repeat protein
LSEYVSGHSTLPAHAIPAKPQAPSFAQASHQSAATDGLSDLVADLESSLGDSFLPGAAAPSEPKSQPSASHTAIHTGAATGTAPALQPAAPAGSFVTQTRPQTSAKPLVAAADAATSVDIADMFSELKHGLEEDTNAPTEDPETHYNLGVAFREMGLLDEAISELQKVCQAVEGGSTFPHLMQAYTWLAQCFLDKGVPEAAIRWYEKALKIPNIDGETCTALHYELGSSYEASQNKTQALAHFMEVYGSNIDYRDVAERVKALKS